MQLLPILLVAVVLAVDEGIHPPGEHWGLRHGTIAAIAIVPVAVLMLWSRIAVWWCMRRLDNRRRGGARAIYIAERMVRWSRWLIVANHAASVLIFGWVGTVRAAIGDVVLLDELIAVLPPLIGIVGTWWAYFPIERRMREALLIRTMDEGQPVYPTLTRGQYVLMQVRTNILLMLAPILMIVALRETVETLANWYAKPEMRQWIENATTLIAAAGVFLFSPLLARLVLDVKPIAPGELRESLTAVCRRHRVRTRELLLWNTNGTMINAAVMGLVSPLRYVMITDALLESLPRDQVEAVMAHEIGHVRRHHLPWLVVCLMASFVVAAVITSLPLFAIDLTRLIPNDAPLWDWLQTAAGVAQLAIGLVIFGWMCRRFERQADTFAAQHLSGMGAAQPVPTDTTSPTGPPTIKPEAVYVMCAALGAISQLNAIDPHRPSWRHGSIVWRMRYLRSITGRPIDRLPIDRLIRWMKVAVAVVMIGGIVLEVVQSNLRERQTMRQKGDEARSSARLSARG